ncbi:glycoside hydrolase family 71 protein [Thermothielavioides terrestris NRRL 8126]|uniref:Glycoside hydrolase family 71 protein n=1 Tax=Thermothielavioides terrestris (strain ATCC 38088 / NRRL 8126) TaxID=578455 RepID=G2RD09_THETT|nr:glycoside hydrolase family 71 protein [Thermothielavioides terrestris NRRL 8126]AEO70702.1 glycoside hydrolase family 71 protein [Thermothielavioides terrestris NRRL 8126]
MAEHQLLDLATFVPLLDAQLAAGPAEPAGNPARWALVNAVIALALRAKMAPGAEAELSIYQRAFYRNATTVMSELILQEPGLLSVQALLAMAMFARATSDTRAFAMLVTSALRQLELLVAAQNQSPANGAFDMANRAQLMQAYGVVSAFEALARQHALLNSPADVSISIGGVVQLGTWSDTPDSKSGLYHGNVSFNGHVADVVLSLSRNGNRGHCPAAACKQTIRSGSGGGEPAYNDWGIWTNPEPTANIGCSPPCWRGGSSGVGFGDESRTPSRAANKLTPTATSPSGPCISILVLYNDNSASGEAD